jgi:hypothetical protein
VTPRIKLALLGGLVAIIGTPFVIFSLNLLSNALLLLAGGSPFPFPWELWLSDPSFLLRWDTFIAGFIALFLIAPFAIRRVDSTARSDLRFPKTGILYGAIAGFICSELLAFIRLSSDFVAPTLFRDGFSALPDVLGYYTTYLPITGVLYGLLAAVIGGCAGAILERYRRRYLRTALIAETKVD